MKSVANIFWGEFLVVIENELENSSEQKQNGFIEM